ncbi:MAG: AarF/ABC1/UbiB kinase family protein [Alphaproteobacteria bacterium]|nr:AarF/ABC1/UbiB kinase family protein [Alphaproteobacteria bacterium]
MAPPKPERSTDTVFLKASPEEIEALLQDQAEDPQASIFQSLPRREQAEAARVRAVPKLRASPPPDPPTSMVVASLMRWTWAASRFRFGMQWDTMRGVSSHQRTAARIKYLLTSMGSTGIRIGKQISMRIDLMPLEVSLMLAALRDEKPPMDFEIAMERVRAAVGRPLDEVFEILDPEPIASTTVECIYQARLRSGRAVAVKVRRNGIRARILADIRALAFITRFDEVLGMVRPGFFKNLRAELLDLATEELNFSLQARQQTLFRKRAKRDRLKWLTAPKIHHNLSNDAVVVSELVAGVRLSEIYDAVDNNDFDFLARLEAMNIDRVKLARRVLQAAWWATFENLFFIAQPTAENIVVQPDNKLVFLDFQDCGTMSSGHKRLFRQMLTTLADDDVSGATQAIVQLLSPLPFIDVYDFNKRIEAGLWYQLFALKDDEASWWERTTIGVWRNVLRAARRDQVTLRLDVLRLMRSTLSFDTLAARLNPDLALLDEFERYAIHADRRSARRFVEDIEEKRIEDIEAELVARFSRVTEGMARAGLWLETAVENLPVSNLALSGKAAYAASQALRFFVATATLLGSAIIARFLIGNVAGWEASLIDHIKAICLSPLTAAALFLLFSLTLRRILFRLEDKGDD